MANLKKIEMLSESNAVTKDDVQKIEESLSILKDAKKELSTAYATQQEQVKTIESLSAQLNQLQANNSKITEELDNYKTSELNAKNEAYNKRLEQLSMNFAKLGTIKTIEQLSKLSENTIAEFENITASAIQNKAVEQLDSVTVPSQAHSQQNVVAQPTQAQGFSFENICKELTKQQTVSGSNSERTLNM